MLLILKNSLKTCAQCVNYASILLIESVGHLTNAFTYQIILLKNEFEFKTLDNIKNEKKKKLVIYLRNIFKK